MKKRSESLPDIVQELELCQQFLANFQDETDGSKKYLKSLGEVAQRDREDIEIYLDDVLSYEGNEAFVNRIEKNTFRYIELFSEAADKLMPEEDIDLANADAFDVWLYHRRSRMREIQDRDDENSSLPRELIRKFVMRIIPREMQKNSGLRTITATDVGSLVKLKGIVTKMTDVQPKSKL